MPSERITVGGLIELLTNYPPDLEVREFRLDLRDPRVQDVIDNQIINVQDPVAPCDCHGFPPMSHLDYEAN